MLAGGSGEERMMNALAHVGRQRGAEKRTFAAVVMEKSGDMIDLGSLEESHKCINHTGFIPAKSHQSRL